MQKIFLDTNIVIDFLGERESFYKPAARVMTLSDKKKIQLFTSPLTIATAYYNWQSMKARSVLDKIRKFKLLCRTSVMDDEVIEKSIHSAFSDFEDALQYYSALASGCNLIITRNENNFKNALIPVMNADVYLKTFKKQDFRHC